MSFRKHSFRLDWQRATVHTPRELLTLSGTLFNMMELLKNFIVLSLGVQGLKINADRANLTRGRSRAMANYK
jgi:hypothetical protein